MLYSHDVPLPYTPYLIRLSKALYYSSAVVMYLPRMNWINNDDIPFVYLVQMVSAIVSFGGHFKTVDGTMLLLVKISNTPVNLWIIKLYCEFIGLPITALEVLPELLKVVVDNKIALEIWHALRGFILTEKARKSGCIAEANYINWDPSYVNMDHMYYPEPHQQASLFMVVIWILSDDKDRQDYADAYPYLPRREVIECFRLINNVQPLNENIIDDIIGKLFDITNAARVKARANKDSE